mmetsp:Transcript_20010/g.60455  ORF Transcript_20010/g.60455 Transcript_20010/m.60455 type:complete len:209 (-) Transcript_20010:138-764(-)
MRLLHQHVHHRGLAVVQVADHRDVTRHVCAAVEQPRQELIGVIGFGGLPLQHLHLLMPHRRDDGHLQGLSVFLHDKCLRLRAECLLGGGVVLLVLVQHDAAGRLVLRVLLLFLLLHHVQPGIGGRLIVFPHHWLLILLLLVFTVGKFRPDVIAEVIILSLRLHACRCSESSQSGSDGLGPSDSQAVGRPARKVTPATEHRSRAFRVLW